MSRFLHTFARYNILQSINHFSNRSMNKVYFLLILFISVPIALLGQNLKISGVVTDAMDGSPLPGVSVVNANKKNIGTITDTDGKYTIGADLGDELVFSFIGMSPARIKVESAKMLNVSMEDSDHSLNEVVVIGYGTVKKRDLSGAVSQVKADDLLKGNPVSSFNQALQGRMAGVMVSQNDGTPGGGINIQVRGTNSFSTNSQPLYIIDGIPFEEMETPSSAANENNLQSRNALSSINPNDIESIEVLKDASATAIYGSRGANGVVIVTTKKGEKGADKVEFSSNFSISKIVRKIDMLSPSTYASYVNEGTENSWIYEGKSYTRLPYPGTWSYSTVNGQLDQSSGVYLPAPDDFLQPGLRTDQYGNQTMVRGTNWQDAIFQDALSQEYNLRVSGGSDKGWHSFSGNYLDQEGIIKESGFRRYSLRANIGRKILNVLDVGMNISYTNTNNDFAKANANDYSIIRSALVFPPTYDPYFISDGKSEELNWLAANPYMYVKSASDQLKTNNVFTSSYAEIKFLKNFKFRQNLGLGYNTNNRYSYYNRKTGEGKTPTNGKAGQSDNWYQNTTAESILTYDNTFDQVHALNVVGGFTYEEANYGRKSMSATNFPSDITGAYDMSQGLTPGTLVSGRGRTNLVSLLARANYSYNGKYIATLSFRRDGSSRFIVGQKFANFASGALAWRISEEKPIKDIGLFDNLKLRLSYGQTGNQGINAYQTQYYLVTSNAVVDGNASSGFAELLSRGARNENLKWETTDQYDAGLDISVLKGRVSLTIDYYFKETKDLLQMVKIAPSTGFSGMWVNSGTVENQGWEFTANVKAIHTQKLKWGVDGNLSFNKNKIKGLENDQFSTRLWYGADEAFIQRNGYPIGAIYGYVEDGFYDNEAEVRANPVYANANAETVRSMIGEIKYRNLDDDPNITSSDRTIIGDTNPDFTFGLTNNLEWNQFTLSFFIQGVIGNDIFNGNLVDVKMANIGNIPQFAYDERWTPDAMEGAKWPKAVAGYNREWKISDRYVEDGSYVKMKNINLGYIFRSPFKGVKNIQLYASVSNVFTITGYRWYDPDVNAFGSDPSRRGVDIYSYPSNRTYSMGLKIDF